MPNPVNARKDWTVRDDEFLVELSTLHTADELVELFGRPRRGIIHACKRLGVSPLPVLRWDDRACRIIREAGGEECKHSIAKKVNKTCGAVGVYAARHGIPLRKCRCSADAVAARMRKLALFSTTAEIAETMGYSSTYVAKVLREGGIKAIQRRAWTQADDNYLRDNYLVKSKAQLCKYLGRSRGSVTNRLSILGLFVMKIDGQTLNIAAVRKETGVALPTVKKAMVFLGIAYNPESLSVKQQRSYLTQDEFDKIVKHVKYLSWTRNKQRRKTCQRF